MRAVVQRVKKASISVNGKFKGQIGQGSVVLIGVEKGDSEKDAAWLASKIVKARIFENENGRMGYDLIDVKGEAMVVSQFTLLGSFSKGCKPSFDSAAVPSEAKSLYEGFVVEVQTLLTTPVITGEFGAYMEVELLNDGPVTFIFDSRSLK